MNAEHLLAHFDRIADAPDAIPRLRRFILDLAVRGKLVPQDPNDEPASELLKRIAAEKARLVKAGEIKKFPAPLIVESDDEPFEVPTGWRWTRLGDLLRKLTDGTHHSPPNESTGDFKYITAKNIKDDGVLLSEVTYISRKVHNEIYSRCNPEKGDILYIKDGATTGVVTLNDLDEPFSMLSSVALLKLPPWLFNRLIVQFLKSPFFYDQMRGFMKGGAITRVTLKRMAPALIPLPPLAEQHRIVAKVDELMTLCDRLEAARMEREATRNRMATASLARLNTPDPDPAIFQNHAAFALNNLTPLTTRPDQIKAFRQTILDLAVRGKLVPQDPNDEPASELLKRIAKDFSRQVAEGKLNKPKSVKPLSAKEGLFSLPRGWAVARFNQVAAIQSNLVDPKRYSALPHIAPDNIESWTARLLSYVSVGEAGVYSGKHLFSAGAILYSKIRPNLAKVAKVNFDGLCSADMYPIHALIDRDFLVKFMITKDFVAQAVKEDNRVAMPKINQSALSDIVVPVPPLAEQHRIVAKVDELMTLCDQLEMSLATGNATSRHLLDALLHEALEPDGNRS